MSEFITKDLTLVSDPLTAQLQFVAQAVIIDNWSPQYIYLPASGRYIAPGVIGAVHSVKGPQLLQATFKAPPGLAQPASVVDQLAHITAFSDVLPPTVGSSTSVTINNSITNPIPTTGKYHFILANNSGNINALPVTPNVKLPLVTVYDPNGELNTPGAFTRFTPQVAGWYRFVASFAVGDSAANPANTPNSWGLLISGVPAHGHTYQDVVVPDFVFDTPWAVGDIALPVLSKSLDVYYELRIGDSAVVEWYTGSVFMPDGFCQWQLAIMQVA